MDKRHEEVFFITDWGVVYYSAFWNGEHCLSAGVALHDDIEEALGIATERERVLDRVMLLTTR